MAILSFPVISRVVIAILVFAAVWMAISRITQRSQLRKLLLETRRIHKEKSSGIDLLVVSKLFGELERGFMQGQTLQQVTVVQQKVLKLYQESERLHDRLKTERISFFSPSSNQIRIQELRGAVYTVEQQTETLRQEVEDTHKYIAEAVRSIEAARRRRAEVSLTLELLTKETSGSLAEIRIQWDQASEVLEEVDRLDEFDPLQAGTLARTGLASLESVAAALARAKEQLLVHHELLSKLRLTELEVLQQVELQGLLMVDYDPIRIVEQAKNEAAKCNDLIGMGNIKEAQLYTVKIEELLLQARQAVGEMLQNRDVSVAGLAVIDRFLEGWDSFDNRYESESRRIMELFDEVHREELGSRYALILEHKKRLEHQRDAIISSVNANTQKYKHALSVSELALHTIPQIERLQEQCLNYRSWLEEKLHAASSRFQMLKKSCYDQFKEFGQLHIEDSDINRKIADCVTVMNDLIQRLESPFKDINRIEEELEQCQSLAHDLALSIERLAQPGKSRAQ
ncbi:MAG: hypothetical protein K0R67_2515 [Paenibacillus sp.]|jgi:chromosome segregation ATPase|nr:hypothetical protein [Paenibacillus sp.]